MSKEAEELRRKLIEVRAAVNEGRAEAQHWFDQGGDYLFRGRLQAYDHVLSVLNQTPEWLSNAAEGVES